MDRKIKLFCGQRREPETFEPLSKAHAAYLRELVASYPAASIRQERWQILQSLERFPKPETATVDFLSGLQDPEIWAAHGDTLSVRFDPRHRRV